MKNLSDTEINFDCGGKCCKAFTLTKSNIISLWQAGDGHSKEFDTVRNMLVAIENDNYEELMRDSKGYSKGGELWFACKHLKNDKCSIYEDRPQMCREFPYYPHDTRIKQCPYKDCSCEKPTQPNSQLISVPQESMTQADCVGSISVECVSINI